MAMNGHPVDKIKILVLGGTWSSYPRAYQQVQWLTKASFFLRAALLLIGMLHIK
jgi:histone acetyltransferase (RNA polymerase elongator complex component)